MDKVATMADIERYIPTNYVYTIEGREFPVVVKDFFLYTIGVMVGNKFRKAGRTPALRTLSEVTTKLKELAKRRKIKKITKKRK